MLLSPAQAVMLLLLLPALLLASLPGLTTCMISIKTKNELPVKLYVFCLQVQCSPFQSPRTRGCPPCPGPATPSTPRTRSSTSRTSSAILRVTSPAAPPAPHLPPHPPTPHFCLTALNPHLVHTSTCQNDNIPSIYLSVKIQVRRYYMMWEDDG